MCITKFEVLCHIISVYEQGKKIGSYILIIDFFFLHSGELLKIC